MKDGVADTRIAARVYKGTRRGDTYLFVPACDPLKRVPCALLDAMGRLDLVLELDLHRGRKLAREDVQAVIRNLRDKGYHLQMPPVETGPGRSAH